MKKIYVQIIDTITGIYQTGMIQEPVVKGTEIQNVLGHFGVDFGYIKWINSNYGEIEGTSKVVSIVII